MKILIIQPKIGMGDMVIYLPYIHSISKKYKTAISLLVKENSRAAEILKNDDQIQEIITLDRKKDNSGSHDGFTGFLNLVKKLKEKKFDKVFIFSSSIRYFFVAKFSGIKKIIHYPFFRKKDNIVNSAKELTEKELQISVSTQPQIKLNKKDVENIKKTFSPNNKHICIGFSASGPTKKWDIKNYLKLCEKINSLKPSIFYLAGGKDDKELIHMFMDSKIANNCKSFDDLKISEAMPIIKNCNLYIGNDTGWLHISSALNVRCLALFMDSPVKAYGKYSKNISIIVPEGETEESTTHNTLGKNKISFDEVFEKSMKLLD